MLPSVLLADDHPVFLDKVASLLACKYEIVGRVGDGQALLEAAKRLQPDVLVIDISMPVLNGIEAARELTRSRSISKVVFLTVHDESDFVQAAFAAGATAYVIKSHMASDLIRAIQAALADHLFLSPPLSLKDTASSL
jgi:DNA-binding NarL/FixJ family response regulator